MKYILLCISMIGIVCLSSFADQNEYETLRKEYSSLRNTDVSGAKLSERRSTIQKLLKLDNSDLSERDGVLALTYAAVLSGETYKFSHEITDAKLARDALQKLEVDYPNSSLVDDAYLALSEVLPPKDKKAVAEILGDKFAKSDSMLALQSKKEEAQAVSHDKKIVVIDPGHGGEDLGAVGSSGVYEKDIVLDIAKRLEALMHNNSHIQVVLTRTGDSFIPLATRTEFANKNEAALFLSLHVNAIEDKKTFGFESYVLDSSKEASVVRLAEQENTSASGENSDVSLIVSELVQKGKQEDSLRIASICQKGILSATKKVEWKTKDLGVKKGPFFVLMGARMPAALLELGFISHEEDEDALLQDEVRDALAEALKTAILTYLQ